MRLERLKWSALLLAAATLIGGCAEQDPDLWIFTALPPDDNCGFSVPSGNRFVGQQNGILDVSFENSYLIAVAAENTLVPSESVTFGTSGGQGGLSGTDTETNRINLRTAQLRFDAPDAIANVFSPSSVSVSAGVAPGGRIVVQLPLVTRAQSAQLHTLLQPEQEVEILIDIELVGQKLSGPETGSNIFRFPILVCNGCLHGVAGEDDSLGEVCHLGQDEASCSLNPLACDGGGGVTGPDGQTYVPNPETGQFFTCPGQPTPASPLCVD